MTGPGISDKLDQLTNLPPSEFVLHRDPMLLLDRIISLKPESAVCEWCVRESDEFLVPGSGVPSYIGIEHMAQCVAVHGGACEHALGSPPPQGLLLGTRHYRCEIPYFLVGNSYQVECKVLISNPDGMCAFDCVISSGNQVLAKARISILQLSRGDTFNE
jgi:predicted hotdog family 3-hydroxylacyl-ACP dehydratase